MRILLYSIFLALGALAPCWQPAAGAAERTVLVVPKQESVRFWSGVRQGALDAGAECGVRVVYRGPLTHESPAKQRAIIEQGIADGVDAVVLAPSSATELSDLAVQVRESGVPLVIIDSAMEGDGYVSFIATDNLEAGRVAARFLLPRSPAGGTILLLRHREGSSATDKREQGFVETVELAGRNDRLLSDYVGVSEGNAFHRTVELLRGEPGITAVFASGEVATLGCVRAIRELGLAGRIRVVGFDDTPEIRKALSDGVLQGVMVQQPYRMGRMGVAAACDAIEGKAVPGRIVTDAVLVTSPRDFGPSYPVTP